MSDSERIEFLRARDAAKNAKRKEYHRQWYLKNKVRISERAKKYREENIDRLRAKNRVWMLNKLALDAIKSGREYTPSRDVMDNSAYSGPIRKRKGRVHSQYAKARRAIDPMFKIRGSLSSRLTIAVRKQYGQKASSTMDMIGCTIDQLRDHLEGQFLPGMNWQNYGVKGWHIDHIKPCAKYNLLDPEEQRACFHFTNLQPLWHVDNIRKGAKLEKAG